MRARLSVLSLTGLPCALEATRPGRRPSATRVLALFLAYLLTFAPVTWAQSTYYYDFTDGDDGNDCLSEVNACKTLADLSGQTYSPGDTILLQCGEEWRHEATTGITIGQDGSSGSPITVGQYGACTGSNDPLLIGSKNDHTWALHTADYDFADGFDDGTTDAWTTVSQGTGQTLEVTTGESRPNVLRFGVANQAESHVKKTGLTLGNQASTLNTGLTAYWKLDEADDAVRADSVGSNDLAETTSDTVQQVAGKVGNAAQFVAADTEGLFIADTDDLSFGTDTDFTIAAWLNLSDVTTNTFRVAANKENGGASNDQGFQLAWLGNSSHLFRLLVGNGSSNQSVVASTFGTPSVDTYYLVVAGHDSTANTLFISVNDGTVDTAAWTGGTQDTTTAFALGTVTFLNTGFWTGRIDEFGFWKKVLSSAEITELNNSGNGKTYPFGATGNVHISFEFNIDALVMADTDQFTIVEVENAAGDPVWQFDVRRSGANYQVGIPTANDGGATTSFYNVDKTGWNHVGLRTTLGNGDGSQIFVVNHVDEETDSSLDNDELDVEEFQALTLSLDTGTSGDAYIDNMIIASTAIGYAPYVTTGVTWNAGGVWEDSQPGLANSQTDEDFLRTHPGSFWFDNPNDLVYLVTTDGLHPSEHTIEVARNLRIIDLEDRDYITVQNVELKFGLANLFVGTSGSNIIFDDVVSHHGNTGLECGDAVTASIIRNSEFYENGRASGGYGANLSTNCDGWTVEENYFHSNGSNANHCDSTDANCWGACFQVADGVTSGTTIIQRNRCECDTSVDELSGFGIRQNHGFNLENGVDDARLFSNKISGCVQSVTLSNADNSEFYNNTIVNQADGVDVNNASYCFGMASGSTGNTFRNNICQGAAAMDTAAPSVAVWVESGSTSNTFDYTLVYLPNAASTSWGTWLSNSEASRASWETSSSQNANSPADGDPLFIDLANGNFRLKPASPAYGAGTDVGLTIDFEGKTVPLGQEREIGAIEFSVVHRRRR